MDLITSATRSNSFNHQHTETPHQRRIKAKKEDRPVLKLGFKLSGTVLLVKHRLQTY